MKRKPILYLIYFLILIVGFVVIVLVRPLIKNSSSKSDEDTQTEVSTNNNSFSNNSSSSGDNTNNSFSNNNSSSGDNTNNSEKVSNSQDNNSSNENNLQNDQNSPIDTNIYATELTLNMPNRVIVAKDKKVKLNTGFYSIKPSNTNVEVEINFISYYNSDVTKVSFIDNEFSASKTGLYKMEIKAKSSPTKYLTKNAIFEVVENDPNISQKEIQLLETKTYSISSLFEIENTSADLTFVTDNLLDYDASNQSFTATNFGTTSIIVKFIDHYTQFDYIFNFTIKEKFDYQILLNSTSKGEFEIATDTLTVELDTNQNFKLTFRYLNTDTNELASQFPSLNIIPSDDNIIETIKSSDYYRIKLLFDYSTSNTKEITINLVSTDTDINVEPYSIKIIFTKPEA